MASSYDSLLDASLCLRADRFGKMSLVTQGRPGDNDPGAGGGFYFLSDRQGCALVTVLTSESCVRVGMNLMASGISEVGCAKYWMWRLCHLVGSEQSSNARLRTETGLLWDHIIKIDPDNKFGWPTGIEQPRRREGGGRGHGNDGGGGGGRRFRGVPVGSRGDSVGPRDRSRGGRNRSEGVKRTRDDSEARPPRDVPSDSSVSTNSGSISTSVGRVRVGSGSWSSLDAPSDASTSTMSVTAAVENMAVAPIASEGVPDGAAPMEALGDVVLVPVASGEAPDDAAAMEDEEVGDETAFQS